MELHKISLMPLFCATICFANLGIKTFCLSVVAQFLRLLQCASVPLHRGLQRADRQVYTVVRRTLMQAYGCEQFVYRQLARLCATKSFVPPISANYMEIELNGVEVLTNYIKEALLSMT